MYVNIKNKCTNELQSKGSMMKEREERGGGVGLGGRVAVCLVFVGTKAKEKK